MESRISSEDVQNFALTISKRGLSRIWGGVSLMDGLCHVWALPELACRAIYADHSRAVLKYRSALSGRTVVILPSIVLANWRAA